MSIENNGDLYCKKCNFIYDSYEIYLAHQIQIHIDELSGNHCKLCYKNFKHEKNYISHLKKFHINGDRYNYCDKCKKQFSHRCTYRSHMDSLHDVGIKKQARLTDKISNMCNPINFCNPCNHTFSSKASYSNHLKNVHNENLIPKTPTKTKSQSKPKTINQDKIANTKDPNNFCKACDHTFSEESSYETHLLLTHKIDCCIFNRTRKNGSNCVESEANIQGFYCNICFDTCFTLLTYRMHMFRLHSIFIPFNHSKIKTKLFTLTNRDDLNNYCCPNDPVDSDKETHSEQLFLDQVIG